MSAQSAVALIVEANYLIAAGIEAPLAACGFQVLIATCDEEARAILGRNTAQIAIIDFRLQYGQRGGLVSLLEARGIPYVFSTASLAEEVAESFPGAMVIGKPYSDQKLLSVVAALRTAVGGGGRGMITGGDADVRSPD